MTTRTRSNSIPTKNGFTLVEVLVALVVTAFLVSILMDGAVSSKSRQQNLTAQTEGLMIAASNIERLRDIPGVQPPIDGEVDQYVWNLSEVEIARDPRKIYVLVEAQIFVGTKKSPRIVSRKKRYLKTLVVQ